MQDRKGGFPTRLTPLATTLLGVGCGALALTLPPTSADAQPTAEGSGGADAGDSNIETLYVIDRAPSNASSAKYTAPLIDMPQTISVIPAEVFKAQGAQNLTDVLRNTPGISFNAGENGFASNTNNFSMRGFDSSGNIFLDGVRDSGNYSRDVFNLEQVEVVKGAAADNGRGGAGGYVNLVTKTPQLQSFVVGTASYGFDGYTSAASRARTTIDINRPLSDASGFRLNALYQDGGIAGRKRAESEVVGIAPSIAFGLGTMTRFTAALQHIDQSDVPDWGVPGATIEGMFRYDPLAAQADRENFYGLDSDFDDTKATTFLARFEHDFIGNVSIMNQTRWTRNERDAVYTLPTGYDPATTLVTTQRQAFARETGTLSNLTNIAARIDTGRVRHTIAAGIELTREESDSGHFPPDATPGTTSIFAPDPSRAPGWRPVAEQSSSVDIDTLALYVYDTMQLSERWQLTGGFRVEHFDAVIGSREVATGLPAGPDGYSIDQETLSGKLGVVFKPAANASIYASWGVSSLPPGSFLSNPDISRTGDNAFPGLTGQNNENAKVQRSVNYELGGKWDLVGGRLSTTAALFRTERRNVGISGKTPGDPDSETTLQGYGKQIVEGLEVGVFGSPTEAWTLYAGVLLMDSEREHSAYLDAARREANPNDYGDVLRTSGDELSFTPRRSANLWSTYRFPVGFTIGGGVRYVGDSWVGRPDDADRIIPNGAYGKLPSYTVTSLMMSYEASDRLFLRLNVENVADELYAISTNWPAQRVFLGAPRSYLLSADFTF